MFSSSRKSKRRRGVILSPGGWQRLESARQEAEKINNKGFSYTLEDLNEITGLSSHTLTKVLRRQRPVDRQTLEDYFKGFNLKLTEADYIRPISRIDNPSKELAFSQQTSLVASSLPISISNNGSLTLEPSLPEGQISLHSKFYIERSPAETNYYKTLLQPGSLIRIKAPRRMGKSSLMVRSLDYATQQGYQTVFLSLQMADRSILSNLDKFLQWFSASVCLGLGLPNRLSGYWDELFGSKISCKIYFEEYLLKQITKPLVLALDDVDRLFDYPELADEFFGLLRTWHEQAKNSLVWQKLRLVVAHSTQVYIPLNVNKSPFNVGVPIELSSLTTSQMGLLAQKYDLDLSSRQIDQLMMISAGQPYLVQLALYALWMQQQSSPQELLQQAVAGKGVYADHLQRLLWTLKKDPQLVSAFSQVLQTLQPIELELLPAFKLESLGLVNLQGNQATVSCSLYAEYFRNHLNQ